MTTTMTYRDVRNEKLNSIRDTFSSLLQEYLILYQRHQDDPSSVSQDELVQKNNQLISIAQQLYANNEFIESDINNIYNSMNFQSTLQLKDSLQSQTKTIQQQKQALGSNTQLTEQYKIDYRRTHIYFVLSILFLLFLIIAIVFMGFKLYQQLILQDIQSLSQEASQSLNDYFHK